MMTKLEIGKTYKTCDGNYGAMKIFRVTGKRVVAALYHRDGGIAVPHFVCSFKKAKKWLGTDPVEMTRL